MIDYKIVNISDQPVGPLNLMDIFGRLCDADPQIVTLQPAQELEFCGEGEDIADIQDRLTAALALLGITTRVIDISHQFVIKPTTEVVIESPEPSPPPEDVF